MGNPLCRPWYADFPELAASIPEALRREQKFREDLQSGKIVIASQCNDFLNIKHEHIFEEKEKKL